MVLNFVWMDSGLVHFIWIEIFTSGSFFYGSPSWVGVKPAKEGPTTVGYIRTIDYQNIR